MKLSGFTVKVFFMEEWNKTKIRWEDRESRIFWCIGPQKGQKKPPEAVERDLVLFHFTGIAPVACIDLNNFACIHEEWNLNHCTCFYSCRFQRVGGSITFQTWFGISSLRVQQMLEVQQAMVDHFSKAILPIIPSLRSLHFRRTFQQEYAFVRRFHYPSRRCVLLRDKWICISLYSTRAISTSSPARKRFPLFRSSNSSF